MNLIFFSEFLFIYTYLNSLQREHLNMLFLLPIPIHFLKNYCFNNNVVFSSVWLWPE